MAYSGGSGLGPRPVSVQQLVGRAQRDFYAPRQPAGNPYASAQFGSALSQNPAFIRALVNLAANRVPSVNLAQAYRNMGGASY